MPRGKTIFFNVTVFRVYAPTEEAVKEEFYSQLEQESPDVKCIL